MLVGAESVGRGKVAGMLEARGEEVLDEGVEKAGRFGENVGGLEECGDWW